MSQEQFPPPGVINPISLEIQIFRLLEQIDRRSNEQISHLVHIAHEVHQLREDLVNQRLMEMTRKLKVSTAKLAAAVEACS